VTSAAACYKEAISLDPESLEATYNMGALMQVTQYTLAYIFCILWHHCTVYTSKGVFTTGMFFQDTLA
jgi:hypothetical protein